MKFFIHRYVVFPWKWQPSAFARSAQNLVTLCPFHKKPLREICKPPFRAPKTEISKFKYPKHPKFIVRLPLLYELYLYIAKIKAYAKWKENWTTILAGTYEVSLFTVFITLLGRKTQHVFWGSGSVHILDPRQRSL